MTVDLAKYLISKGFPIIDLDKHRKDSNGTVFIFKYTNELQNAMDIYFQAKKLSKQLSA